MLQNFYNGLFINHFTKLTSVSILILILVTSTSIGSISVEPVFSQTTTNNSNVENTTSTSALAGMGNETSTLQSAPEGENIVSESPVIDVVPGKPIEPIPNSFIVEIKPAEVGAMEDTVSSLTSNISSYGGNVSSIFPELNMFSIKFEPQDNVSALLGESNVSISEEARQFIEKIKDDPNVANIFTDATVTIQAQVLPNDQNRVDADLSQAISGNGKGLVNTNIAIVDTGVQQDHPDLRVVQCLSFIDNPTPGTPLNTCNDGHGHGTHVAGTAAAKDNKIGVVGKAPGAKIWAMKVLSDSGSGSFSDILEAINYIASHSDKIDVVNMSLGGIGSFPPLETAITNLVNNKGVVVVVAAGGSNGDANNFTPARTPAAITVSAMSDSNGKCGGGGPDTGRGPDDSFSTYSNHGLISNIIDIAAPGTNVFSTYKNSGYATMSGTSMASPNVAGAAALYLAINPSATPAQVDAYLKSTGTKAPSSGDGLVPCDGNGKGYFTYTIDDDPFREPLLYMKKQQK